MRQSNNNLSTKPTGIAAYTKHSKISAAIISMLACSPFATAQQAQVAEPASIQLEEIVVSARRVQESLQEAPVAITAFNSDALELRNIQSVDQITNFVPNVQFDNVASESGGGASSQISIRGIGQTDWTITVEPAVGLYLDGVYIGKSVGSLMDTVDLAGVEVLRGPQGTLFGKNTIGGAVLLTSKKPSDETEFSAEVTGGDFGRADLKVAGNIPVSDTFRVRGSFATLNRDGHVDRILTGETQGNKDAQSARIVADWDVSDSLKASFAVDASKSREESPGQVTLAIDETAFFASLHNGILFPQCAPGGDPARFSNPVCANSQFAAELDDLQSTNTGPNQSDTDVFGFSATLNWDLDNIDVKSITAYRDVEVDVLQELTGTPAFRNDIGNQFDLELFSQELQFSGAALDERLNYIFGVYYGTEEGSQVFPVILAPANFTSGGEIDNTSLAAFGQLGYDLTDSLSLTLGARISDEEKKYTPRQQINSVNPGLVGFFAGLEAATGGGFAVRPGLPLFPAVEVTRDDTEFTPSVTLDYKFGDGNLAYASYSEGFKSGGFTLRGFPPVIPGVTTTETDVNTLIPSFGPETAQVLEFGLKTQLFDNRVRLNAAVFRTNYDDLQLTANAGVSAFVPVLINAGDAEITGLELEANILAAEWLRLDVTLGLLDSEYETISEEAQGAGVTLDNDLPNAPETTGTFGATVDFFDNDNGHLFLRTDVSYKDSQFKTVGNEAILEQDSYTLVNAALTYQPNDNWQATLGGTNLTDEIYIVSGVANGGIGYAQAIASRPREWYFTVKYSF